MHFLSEVKSTFFKVSKILEKSANIMICPLKFKDWEWVSRERNWTWVCLGKVEYLDAYYPGLPRWYSGKESACQCRKCRRREFGPWVPKIPWSRKWQPTAVFLPGQFHGQRSLVSYSPWGRRIGRNWVTEHMVRKSRIFRCSIFSFGLLQTPILLRIRLMLQPEPFTLSWSKWFKQCLIIVILFWDMCHI